MVKCELDFYVKVVYNKNKSKSECEISFFIFFTNNMCKFIQRYNKIKVIIGAMAKSTLVLNKKKFNNFVNIEKNHLKNTLFVITLIFLGSFSLIVVISAKQIEKKLLNINIVQIKNNINPALEKKIKELTDGYPIERMTRYIAVEDKEVAAFIISIAKKESNWGKRTPKLNGEECYNYWGFRQKRERMGSGGHTCFDSPKDAVKAVSSRVKDLIEKGVNTPEKMVVWKCGYNCESHNQQSVQKWINDVKLYYNKI